MGRSRWRNGVRERKRLRRRGGSVWGGRGKKRGGRKVS